MYKPYTMIGSRSTPEPIIKLMKNLSSVLCNEGFIVRSGGANGADSCANHVVNKEIYLPWNGFNGHYADFWSGFIVYSDLNKIEECDKYCEIHHGWWKSIKKESVKHLHRRNIHQILGATLESPSNFVVCYAEPDDTRGSGHVKGGTGTAVSLALSHGIKVINLFYQDNVDEIKRYLGESQ